MFEAGWSAGTPAALSVKGAEYPDIMASLCDEKSNIINV